jgi:hypothetical protein
LVVVARICADQLVITEQPKVAEPRNCLGLLFRDNVTAVGLPLGWGPWRLGVGVQRLRTDIGARPPYKSLLAPALLLALAEATWKDHG